MKILETKNLKKYYGNGNSQVKALDGISLQIEEGELVAIVGCSGSGKSTLLHMLGGLDYPTSGTVTVAGKEIFQLNETELTIFRRRRIGFVFQSYNLIPILNVYENIVLPIELDGKKPDTKYISAILHTLGIADQADRLPGQLSGGQQQRAAIARALATRPSILLADEPTGNLDSRSTQEVMGLLKLSGDRFHQTIVMITHNEALAQLCNRIIHVEDGKIIDDSSIAKDSGYPTKEEDDYNHSSRTKKSAGDNPYKDDNHAIGEGSYKNNHITGGSSHEK